MPYPICRHIKSNGIQCGSPALLSQRHCYYHKRLTADHRNYRPNPRLDPFFEPGRHIRLTAVEDSASVLLALSQTVNALATGQIELKHGRAILYGLNLAAIQIKEQAAHPEFAPDQTASVQTIVYSDDYLHLAPILPTGPILEGDPVQLLEEPSVSTLTAEDVMLTAEDITLTAKDVTLIARE